MRPVNSGTARPPHRPPRTPVWRAENNCDRTDAGIGTSLPKFVTAESPRIARAAASYASAASSAESNVPNHCETSSVGSRISAPAYLPHGRCLTPLYTLFCGFPLEFNDGDAAAADVGMDATATAAAVASFTATLAISIFFTLDALVAAFTPPDFTDGDEEKCAIAARGGSLRLAGGLNALNPLFGDPM